jgi:D-lactate dehydrogenase
MGSPSRSPSSLSADLRRLFPSEVVLDRALDRVARSVDASIYRLLPEVVVRPRHLDDLRHLMAYAARHQRHLTFRGAGTSLSGQAVGDDILVEIGASWRDARVLDQGRRISMQPGIIGGHVNGLLAPYGRRLGPDPASIDSATIGGILANNASGMCCGIAQNSYQTLDSLTVALANGTVVDTATPDADARLRREQPALHAGVALLRDRTRADPELVRTIRRVLALKNTTGYLLAAFLDEDEPARILARLMIGSQGTLGFIAAATLRTVEDLPARATALVVFADAFGAASVVPALRDLGCAAVEILDAAALRACGQDVPAAAASAALLIEFAAADEEALRAAVAPVESELARQPRAAECRFTSDPVARERLWRIRKGLLPSIGSRRPTGTAVVIEDVAVPVEALAAAIVDLQQLFVRHDLVGTAIFGHAKDGNLHFVMAEDFAQPAAVARYAAFMQDLVELVLGRYGGALKAEHGSGRNMAPFVRAQWGEAAYGLMRELKRLLDPAGILNPGVILTDDSGAHLRNLKTLPAVSPIVDACIECGFCEPRCPSRDVTLSPRQRIVVLRELARAIDAGWRDELARDFEHGGIETCVRDGMCGTSCPVSIDTGAAMKSLHARSHPAWRVRASLFAADHMGLLLASGRAALRMGSTLQRMSPGLLPRRLRGLALPTGAPPLPAPRAPASPAVVYFPSCLTRLVGPLPGENAAPLGEAVAQSLAAVGFSVRIPPDVRSLCCGLLFGSKGYEAAAERARSHTVEGLRRASDGGRWPMVTDASPCALALASDSLRVDDFPSFWAREGLPRAPIPRRRRARAVVHPACSLRRQEGLPALVSVAQAYAEDVRIPLSAECCGFAGDRGFVVPEVTAAALVREAAEIRTLLTPGAAVYSTSRTCELGLSRAVGVPCQSVVQLVWEAIVG